MRCVQYRVAVQGGHWCWVSAVRSLSRIVESDGDTAPPGRLARVFSSSLVIPPHLARLLRPPVFPPLPQGSPGNLLTSTQ